MIIVYSYYVLDIVHQGHLVMMENCKRLAGPDGRLIVGILTDGAVLEKKHKPVLSFNERFSLAMSIKHVDLVVAQETYSPLSNIRTIKPDILAESSSHGEEVINASEKYMKQIGGRVIVLPYHPGQSSTIIKKKVREEYE